MDLCPNLWCNNSKAIFFLAGNLFSFDISLIFPRNSCFLCALCGKVTAFLFSAPNYTVQNPLWKRQLCPAFINVIIEINLSHKSGAKSTLYNVAMNVFPLSSHICIRTWPFCFAVTWCLSATSMYLSVSSNYPEMKSVTSGDSLQLTNWILDLGARWNMSPEVTSDR